MTEKEFRKLRSLDLIQILLTQGNEEARLQEELDRQKEHLAGLREHNENLKTELNEKDALIETLKQELNNSDAKIQDLREELKSLYTDKRINLENIGSLTEVAQRVNHIFEIAQRQAEEYLAHPERVFAMPENTESDDTLINHKLTVKDFASKDDIEVEVAEKACSTKSIETSESMIFETSDSPCLELGTDSTIKNTDEVMSENITSDVTEHLADDTVTGTTEHLAGDASADRERASADDAVDHATDHTTEITAAEATEHNPPDNIEEVVNFTAKEAVADTIADSANVKPEPHHHHSAPKKAHSNKKWFRKLLPGAKREKPSK